VKNESGALKNGGADRHLVHNSSLFTIHFQIKSNRASCPVAVSLPLDRAAIRYYDQGETGLARHVPYAIARHLNHLGFVVLPLVGLAVVVVKFLPVVLRTWTSLRLTGLYKKLEAVEKADAAGADRAELLAQLAEIDQASSGLYVPRSNVADYIDFRQFLHDMRERIAGGSEQD
jgi:hypothetical protein